MSQIMSGFRKEKEKAGYHSDQNVPGTNLPAGRFGGRTAHAPAILEDGGAQGEDGRTDTGRPDLTGKDGTIFIFFIFIAAILASISIIQCQNYKTFVEKHIVEDQAKINCNITIKDRNINKDSCRYRNTFIHDTDARKIREMCSRHVASTVVSSDGSLTLTDCKLLKSPSAMGCSYNQAVVKGVVYVTCERQVPVHFVRFEPGFAAQCAPCIWTLGLLLILGYLF
ncbi:unnamed protein product [Ranitomeya imitator]|uniref:Ribonuclease A-domain domain-containing protein n=1 Tax=Ranitomeya imitator TaxID=111125 RepID=A0ABN9MJV1_9NEOB|nr:unnamed protein product [Ranitomeya imitator]